MTLMMTLETLLAAAVTVAVWCGLILAYRWTLQHADELDEAEPW